LFDEAKGRRNISDISRAFNEVRRKKMP